MSREIIRGQEQQEKKKQLSVNAAREHLNASPEKYFEIINGSDPEDLVEYIGKMKPLTVHQYNPERVVSVGVGGGLELHALRELYPSPRTQIIGLDLSDKAIRVARAYLDLHHVDAELIQGSTIDMPFIKEGMPVDGIVFSAILHEVYSYMTDGKTAWKEAIADATRNLKEDGILLIRDFAAPFIDGDVWMSFLSDDARQFYEYFRNRYRTFQTWKEADREAMQDRRIEKDDFPEISKSEGAVTLSFDKAAELMLHFRNYADHINKQLIQPNDTSWKEADERYLIPDPDSKTLKVMPPHIYINRVIQVANDACNLDVEFKCVGYQIGLRPNTSKFLMMHFGLEKDGTDTTILFNQIPSKMELVFKKMKKVQ